MTAQTQLQTIPSANLSAMSPSSDEWRIITEQSQMLLKSGFLPQSIKTPEQAVAIILQGRELGIPTMAALGTINVIQGKPTVSPQLMLALINRSNQLENIEIKQDGDSIVCTMKRRGRTAHTETFGKKEAADTQLGGKDNYKKQPMTMYRWRAVAACARTVFPDVVLGIYTPDEMGANNINIETGELIPEPAQIRSIPPQGQPPTKSQLVEQAKTEAVDVSAADPLAKQLADLCKTLNESGDSIKWTGKTLTDWANDLLGTEHTSIQQFDAEQKNFVIQDLQERFVELNERAAIAAESSDAIDGEVVETETVSVEEFAKSTY